MSPASQGALEVEHYIGSCLISSSVRTAVGGKTLIPGITKKQQESPPLHGKQQRDYTQQGNYLPGNEQCQYGTWAGAPLISMTSSPRRNHQQSSPPPCQNHQQSVQQQQGQVQTRMQNQSPLSRLAIHTQGAPLILAGRFHNRGKIQSCNGMNGTSMNSSVANILNANINVNVTNYCNGNSVSVESGIGNSIINSAGKCVSSRGQRLAEPARKPQQQQQQSQQQVNPKTECINGKVDGTNIANIDSLSIASDESSGSNNSENSLPRIIKPRKRRKKDRKPAGVTVTELPSKTDDHQQHQQQQSPLQQQQSPHQQTQQNNQHQHQNHPNSIGNYPNGTGISEQSSIVTLKPYVPICYENRYEHNRGHRRPQPISKESYTRSQNQNVSCNGPMQLNQQQKNHQQQEISDTRQQHHQHHHHHQQHQQQQQQRYTQRHVQVKVLDDNKNVIMPILPASTLGRSMALPSKGNIAGTNNYHHRNHYHMAHHHHHHHHHHHQHNEARNGNSNNNSTTVVGNGSGIINTIPRHRYAQHHLSHPQHQQLSQHEYEPMLMGCDDNIALIDSPSGSLNSAGCQCRYCDPSGLIWDVDQNVYSPFLTPPHASEFPVTVNYGVPQQHQFTNLPLFLSRTGSAITCQEQPASNGCEYYELPDSPTIAAQRGPNHNNHHQISRCVETSGASTCNNSSTGNTCNAQVTSAVTMLRRSWSDPTSYFSEEITVPSRDVGVIGDRGQTEIAKGRSSWPGSSASGLSSGSAGNSPYGNHVNLPISSQGLEVSTEIVTSPNGHRDLEIKFYSSSPSAQPIEDDKSAFLDDGEDFSDIWSYHESKLQQDFRTLLQAEE